MRVAGKLRRHNARAARFQRHADAHKQIARPRRGHNPRRRHARKRSDCRHQRAALWVGIGSKRIDLRAQRLGHARRHPQRIQVDRKIHHRAQPEGIAAVLHHDAALHAHATSAPNARLTSSASAEVAYSKRFARTMSSALMARVASPMVGFSTNLPP